MDDAVTARVSSHELSASPTTSTAALGADIVADMTGNATLTGAVDDFNSILASLKPVGASAPLFCAARWVLRRPRDRTTRVRRAPLARRHGNGGGRTKGGVVIGSRGTVRGVAS